MAITLKQAVTTRTTCELSALKEGILAAAREAKENDRHDFELWAVVNGKAYKQLVDGESELGQSIYRMGSYHASVEDKKKLLHEHLLPKVK